MSTDSAQLDGMTVGAGDHVCVFYRGEAERRRLLSDFLGASVRAGTACLGIVGEDDQAWLRESLGDTAENLTLESYPATYTHGGSFDRSHMLEYLYDLDRLGGHVIIPALRAHPAVLVRGVLVRNPYCVQPAA